MTHWFTESDARRVLAAVQQSVKRRGADFYAWRDAPQWSNGSWCVKGTPLTEPQAEGVFRGKLDGAYGERFVLFMALIPGLIERGHRVALLQVQKETAAFDATGWLVLSIDGHPMFHISPDDLSGVDELVTVVAEGTPEAETHRWKNTTKVDEFVMLLEWMKR